MRLRYPRTDLLCLLILVGSFEAKTKSSSLVLSDLPMRRFLVVRLHAAPE